MITLATLPEATSMEVFQQVKTHLLTQGVKSRGANGMCKYRGENGCKCAAGCLIADEEYKREMEYRTWDALIDKRYVPYAHERLIMKLQRLHDGNAPQAWGALLDKLEQQVKKGLFDPR